MLGIGPHSSFSMFSTYMDCIICRSPQSVVLFSVFVYHIDPKPPPISELAAKFLSAENLPKSSDIRILR